MGAAIEAVRAVEVAFQTAVLPDEEAVAVLRRAHPATEAAAGGGAALEETDEPFFNLGQEGVEPPLGHPLDGPGPVFEPGGRGHVTARQGDLGSFDAGASVDLPVEGREDA